MWHTGVWWAGQYCSSRGSETPEIESRKRASESILGYEKDELSKDSGCQPQSVSNLCTANSVFVKIKIYSYVRGLMGGKSEEVDFILIYQ